MTLTHVNTPCHTPCNGNSWCDCDHTHTHTHTHTNCLSVTHNHLLKHTRKWQHMVQLRPLSLSPSLTHSLFLPHIHVRTHTHTNTNTHTHTCIYTYTQSISLSLRHSLSYTPGNGNRWCDHDWWIPLVSSEAAFLLHPYQHTHHTQHAHICTTKYALHIYIYTQNIITCVHVHHTYTHT